MSSQYANKGLIGFANLGNTCFLNTVMQCISHTYELNDFLNDKTYMKRLNHIPESILLIEWDKLREMIWKEDSSNNSFIVPTSFVTNIQKVARIKQRDIFTGFSQNDVSEFLYFLIESFHESIKRKVTINIEGNIKTPTDELASKCFTMFQNMYSEEYSELLDMFYGIHVSRITDISGKVIGDTCEPYFSLSLQIPKDIKQPSLIDCFESFVKPEILDGDNKFELEDSPGTKVVVKKQINFWSFPNILIIDLKRFSNNMTKNNICITLPMTMDLSKYVIGYNKETYIYELYGTCNHSGNLRGGHYTACVKNANGKWYHFNDTSVTIIQDIEQIQTSKAYCLFYRKKKVN